MATIDLKDAGEYVIHLSTELHERAIVGLRLAAARGLQTVQTVIIPSRKPKPVDRGIYRAAWKVRPLPNGAEIYNDSPIAALIEYGVRASNIKIGRRMLEALAEWVIRKGLVRHEKTPKMLTKEGRAEMKRAKAIRLQSQALEMAWAIAKKAKAGKGFHNTQPGGGQQIMAQLQRDFLPGYIATEVNRQLGK